MRTDIRPSPGGRWLGRAGELALFWAVLFLLGAGALVSFYYEEHLGAESQAAREALGPAYEGEDRIYRYQTESGELTVYPAGDGEQGKNESVFEK